jgi:hypothetical protein
LYSRLHCLSRSVIDDFVGLNVVMHVMLCSPYSVLGRCSDIYETFRTNKQVLALGKKSKYARVAFATPAYVST